MSHESEDHHLVMAAPEDTPMSFFAECIGDGLEEQSQFSTPPIIEREIALMHNLISNDARYFVQDCCPVRIEATTIYAPSTDGRVDSTSRGLSSDDTTNHRRSLNHFRSSTKENPIEEYDVLTQFSPNDG